MSQEVRTYTKTFQASAALSVHRRVRLDASGELVYAGPGDQDALGTLTRASLAADEKVSVALLSAEGTLKHVASGVVARGATVYASDDGKIDASGSIVVGTALEAAAADGDIIEVLHSQFPAAAGGNSGGGGVRFFDDFFGSDLLKAESGSQGIWTVAEVALNTAIEVIDAQDNGVVQLEIDVDSNAEDACLYFGDVRGFPVDQNLIFEARIQLSVLPTTGVAVAIGMAGDRNVDLDTITESAWFRLQAGADLLLETDDTTNNNDDQDTTFDIVVSTWYVLKIDFSDLTDVKFYVDGVEYLASTTFDMSNLTSAEAQMQPYFCLDKASGTGVGTLLIDYVDIRCDRT